MKTERRPGRSSAWSKMSARFVPAKTTTPVEEPKPSISTNIWFLNRADLYMSFIG